jgi:hypothetical protein
MEKKMAPIDDSLEEYLNELVNIFSSIDITLNDILNSEIWNNYVEKYKDWYNSSIDINIEPVLYVPGAIAPGTSLYNVRILLRYERNLILYGFGDIIAVEYFLYLYQLEKNADARFPDIHVLLGCGLGKKFYNSYLSNDDMYNISFMLLYKTFEYELHNIFIGTPEERYVYLNNMRSKLCTSCKQYLPKNNFAINITSYDKLFIHCNSCALKHSRTINSKINSIYRRQRKSSIKREHILPIYSLEWFTEWCLNNKIFITLFNNWVNSGYNTDLAPSVDRVNNEIGYTETNIQVMTWKENYEKEYVNRNKPISMYSIIDNSLIHTFENMAEAAKAINISRTQFGRYINDVNNYVDKGLMFSNYIWKLYT